MNKELDEVVDDTMVVLHEDFVGFVVVGFVVVVHVCVC